MLADEFHELFVLSDASAGRLQGCNDSVRFISGSMMWYAGRLPLPALLTDSFPLRRYKRNGSGYGWCKPIIIKTIDPLKPIRIQKKFQNRPFGQQPLRCALINIDLNRQKLFTLPASDLY